MKIASGLLILLPFYVTPTSAADTAVAASTCGSMKRIFKAQSCCNAPTQSSAFQIVPMPATRLYSGTDASRPGTNANFSGVNKLEKKNYCASTKLKTVPDYDNKDCMKNDVMDALEQSGTDVTKNYKGEFNTTAVPITTSYLVAGLCPVNVHWHLGTEHKSVGQYDKTQARRLATTTVDKGYECNWDGVTKDATYSNEYDWQHCTNMKVGETYEVHWPHSKMGACGTPYQFQSPFYDGVFCLHGDADSRFDGKTESSIGVQAQVFTVVNDESYYYPDLMRGMIVDGDFGTDIAYYTGSTTGSSRSNTICSVYSPITWQVDRLCHLISASSFDKMCADMKSQSDDMSSDLHPHGSRPLVLDSMAANNHQRV